MNNSIFDVIKTEAESVSAELFDERIINDNALILKSGNTEFHFSFTGDELHIIVQHKNLRAELADFCEDRGDTLTADRIRCGKAEDAEEEKAFLQDVRKEIAAVLSMKNENEQAFYETMYRLFWKEVDRSNISF